MADEYIKKYDAVDAMRKMVIKAYSIEYGAQNFIDSDDACKVLNDLPPADVIPIKWIQKKIDKSIGMEHAMWSKLLRMWENEQLRKYVRNLKDDNK